MFKKVFIDVIGTSSGSSGGVIMNVLTSGSNYVTSGSSSGGSGGAGTPYGISGGSAIFSNGRVISGGSGSGKCQEAIDVFVNGEASKGLKEFGRDVY